MFYAQIKVGELYKVVTTKHGFCVGLVVDKWVSRGIHYNHGVVIFLINGKEEVFGKVENSPVGSIEFYDIIRKLSGPNDV